MTYAFIDNDLIFIANRLEDIPQGTLYFEVDTENSNELKIQDGMIVPKSQEEILQSLKEQAIQQLDAMLYQKLQPTDWIIIKCAELNLDMAQEYPAEAQRRLQLRTLFSNLEEQLLNSLSKEEINDILSQAKQA
jgi:hypothetical protein